MRRLFLPIILGATIASAAIARAGSEVTPLQVTIQREPVELSEPMYRAYGNSSASNQFTFVVPKGFRMQGDPATGKLTLGNMGGSCTISISVIDSIPTEADSLSPDAYRDLVTRDNPKAKITQEFSRSAAGRNGPAFDIQWSAGGNIVQVRRTTYIPTSMGIIEFTATATKQNFAAAQADLDLILMTFRYTTKGKLEVVHLGNKA